MTLRLQTSRFGEIEFDENVVLTFAEGILGFDADRHFVLLEHAAEGSPFKWLQSIDTPELAFIVIDPTVIDPNYRIEMDVDLIRRIGTDDPAQCALMCIVNVPHDHPHRMTANLKAPLVVNVETRQGHQTILGSQTYAIRTPIFPHLWDEEEDPVLERGLAG